MAERQPAGRYVTGDEIGGTVGLLAWLLANWPGIGAVALGAGALVSAMAGILVVAAFLGVMALMAGLIWLLVRLDRRRRRP